MEKKINPIQLDEVSWLRRPDSNERPPGYEPGELPTAPLRDVIILANDVLFSIADAKVLIFSETAKKNYYFFVFVWVIIHFLSQKFVIFLEFTWNFSNFAHENTNVQSMSISKTEQTFVDVARKLFAKNGLDGTTMNDIARESGKGRRTLYTYFSKKEDIYSAVIESELERLSEKLDEVASKKIRPQDKIIELIYTHLSMIRETVVRNGNLRAEFFRNIWMVEKVRKKFDADEIALFRKVYQNGVKYGEFDIDNINLVADITHYCVKGLEVPYIYGRLGQGLSDDATRPIVRKVVYGALGKMLD